MATTTAFDTRSRAPAPRAAQSLDDLAARSLAELDTLYRTARVSTSMRAADGPLPGRMLAVRGVGGPLGAAVKRWAASRSFLWAGKTFAADGERTGTGINRVAIPNVLGRQNLFPFATHFGASAIDGAPTLVLDYDVAENPGYIRHIHDEIREVSPSLFLGPAMWKSTIATHPPALAAASTAPATATMLLLWFALDARSVARQARS